MRKYIHSHDIRQKYPDFLLWGIPISTVSVTKQLQFIRSIKKRLLNEFRNKYTTETIKNAPEVMAIRKLFTQMGINPEAELTAVDNLSQLFYKGGLPNINSVVDSCNIASLATIMPIGVFDDDQIKGDLVLRLSNENEHYEPIGMDVLTLKQGIVVLSDDNGIIARPLYKDSKRTMITLDTKNILIVTAQYPPISDTNVASALNKAKELVTTSSKGTAGTIFKFF